jgi:hypothetical protein
MLMKPTTILSCLILFLAACQQPQKPDENKPAPFDEAAETAAIMKVIENETKCFFDGNYECWAANWSHEPYAMQAWNNSDGTADAAVSWDKINAQGKGWIEEIYKSGKNVIHPVVKRDKPQVKFFNETTAYLLWKQYNANKEATRYRVSQETRLMEKQADGWKIVNVSAFWDTEGDIPADSLHIN